MMSTRQQRQLIEAAFLPRACKCTVSAVGAAAIRVSDPVSDVVLLEVDGVCIRDLVNWAAISTFAADLLRKLPRDTGDERSIA
jgi:hypothetical protein